MRNPIYRWTRIAAAVLLPVLLCGCMEEPAPTEPSTTATPTTEATYPTVHVTEPDPMPLVLEQPLQKELTTMDDTLVFRGIADTRYPLLINGQPVQTDEAGNFTYEAALQVGENDISVSYLEETLSYSVRRRYTTSWYDHAEGARYCSGASIYGGLYARSGSTVTVSFRGEESRVYPSDNQLGSGAPEGFPYYTCRFDAPSKNEEELDLGPMTYTVTCDGITETYTTGSILCGAAVEMKRSDPDVTPDTGNYRDVGSGYIVEIVDVNAETFNGRTVDDSSNPTRNYLPKGTVDYGSQGVYRNERARRNYYLLRCGVRVYQSNDNKPLGMEYVVDCYNGYLPDHNEINIASLKVKDHFTYLTLDCLWKAPFVFTQEEQDYTRENWQRYVLEEYDAGYVDITFCYATQVTGTLEIPEDHPLFSGAELIEGEADYTLRLYLKEPGGFYGWNAYYNEEDQLCFQFLNPVTVPQAENPYGADLTGIKVMIDVGHGGEDPGACYTDSNGKLWEESERNLTLAQLVKAELESIGAQVVMNREREEDTVTRTERIAFLVQESPDFCLCIHHNADLAPAMTGFESWYFTPFSHRAAEHLHYCNLESGAYRGSNLAWHYYFMARQTACPIVLAENGYMSNKWEMDQIASQEIMEKKAAALTQAVVNYFLENSGYPITYDSQ